MPERPEELQELRERLAQLTQRVYRLEQQAGLEPAAPPPVTPAAVTPPAVAPAPRPPAAIPAPPAPSPAAAKPRASLESRIGSQWLNRIGIVAVLIGASYFLKYAFDNNWIGPGGRVAIGLVAGILVVLWSERFLKRGYRLFSFSLKAVGLGVLYLSLWASFQVYHLLPAGAAFAAMVVVTAATAILALRQNAEIVAAFAVIGGFATPVLLSTGVNREIALFSYVTLLDLATLALVAFRPWKRLLIASFVGTLVLYIGWVAGFYSRSQLRPTFLFATLFFLIFAVVPLVVGRETTARAGFSARTLVNTVVVLTLANATAYFFQIYDLLEDVNRTAIAWIAVAAAAIYLLLSSRLRSVERTAAPGQPSVVRLLHVALAVGFLTVAVPLKLATHWITMGWFVESGVLLWIADRGRSAFLRNLAVIALALGVFRLLVIDNFETSRLLFNSRAACYALAIAVLAGVVAYGRKHGSPAWALGLPVVAINLLALIGLSLEVRDVFARQTAEITARMHSLYTDSAWQSYRAVELARDFAYSAVWMAYGAALMVAGFWKRQAFLRWQALVLIAVTIGKVFIYDFANLERGYRILSFIVLGVLLLGVSFAYQRDWLKLSGHRAVAEKGESASA